MEELIEQLMQLRFTRTEASVYVILVKNGQSNGYKIGKILGLSRSTIYSALDSLYQRGCIYLVPGESNEYIAKEPDKMLEEIMNAYEEVTDNLKEKFSSLEESKELNFINIKGINNTILKVKEMLLEATREVYINTDFELTYFEEEFNTLRDRGVRIIVVTFSDQDISELPVEVYSQSDRKYNCRNTRMMIVVDFNNTFIASNLDSDDFYGTFSENRLLTHIVSEHIHHDIYFMKLRDKHNSNLIQDDILIKTIMEKQSEMKL